MKTNLTYAFAEMRRRGILARQNGCCIEHAGTAISNEAATLVIQGIAVRGICFYAGEDAIARQRGWDFYLSFGQVQTPNGETIGMDAEDLGYLIVRCLDKYKVDYLWDCTAKHKILVVGQSIQRITPEQAKRCKLPAKAKVKLGNLERYWWIPYCPN